MGKKEKTQKKNVSQNLKNGQSQVIKSEIKETVTISKLSKKQRKRLRKEQNKGSHNVQSNNDEQEQPLKQQTQKQQTLIEVEDSQNQSLIEQNQSFISINSSQIQENYGNEIDLNQKGKQGFEDLMDQQDEKPQEKAKSIKIKRFNTSQIQQVYHIYQIQKYVFYRVSSLSHEKINSTHLNENASIKIFDQNLLKFSNQHESSTLFWINGEQLHKQISFIKSTVFKVVQNQLQEKFKENTKNTQKDKKKSGFKNITEKLRQNIEKFIRPTRPEQTSEFIEFLRDFDWKDDCIIISKEKLIFKQTSPPFQSFDEKLLSSNNSLLILGKKNSGKSTLSEYLKNIKPQSVCILDCDIGRSLSISGCVSLLTSSQTINLWIGEFTPFNCISKYVAAIKKLYQVYRDKYFSKKLVINTMGYLSGVGEMIIYEIYHLINPSQVIVINSQQTQMFLGYDNIGSIIKNIRTGTYLTKLLTLSGQDPRLSQLRQFSQKKLSLNVHYLSNEHAQSKGIPIRFENLLSRKNFKSIIELIKAIKTGEFQKANNLTLYEQDKLGNVIKIEQKQKNRSDMRIVLIGRWLEDIQRKEKVCKQKEPQSELFRVLGVGFGFEGSVYFSREQVQSGFGGDKSLKEELPKLKGLVSEGVDFEKNFYVVNEMRMIEFELKYGRISFMLPIIKGMGSKGIRNKPSKNA